MGQKRKRKHGKESVRREKNRCLEESLDNRRETSQNIVQDEPVKKTEEPHTISVGLPLKHKNIKKGKKRKKTSSADGAPSKRKRAADGVGGAQTRSPSDFVAAPLALEYFTFHRKLGEGSYGKVMLATYTVSGHQLAIKMVKKRELLKNCRKTIRIEREILEITGGSSLFTHAYGTFQTTDYVFYAMEYLSGGDLTEFISSRAPLDFCTTSFLAAEILSGLQFLHSKGIIHRDIKPDNILLDSDGHAKIADFGLAVKNVFGCKKIREVAGTLGYMAPEILHKQLYNYTVDLFSFGIIFYQMATGSYPFYAGQESARIEHSVKYDKPQYPENIHPRIKDVLERLLCKSPKKRQVDCDNLKGHSFFCSINWVEIETGRSRPPFTIRPTPVMETSDIIELHQVMSNSEAQKPPITLKDERLFCGFSYVSDRWKSIHSHRDTSKAMMEKPPPFIPHNI